MCRRPGVRGALFVTFVVALVAAVARARTVLGSVLVATALPWLLDRAGTDPAFGNGPTATIVQDLPSLVICFAIATDIIT